MRYERWNVLIATVGIVVACLSARSAAAAVTIPEGDVAWRARILLAWPPCAFEPTVQ